MRGCGCGEKEHQSHKTKKKRNHRKNNQPAKKKGAPAVLNPFFSVKPKIFCFAFGKEREEREEKEKEKREERREKREEKRDNCWKREVLMGGREEEGR